jgi:hypothetical protein
MAGFSKQDAYYAPRMTLVWDNHSWSDLTKCLLPNIEKWGEQMASPTGDKSKCAKKFLCDILPWFAEVLIQDGIFFIHDFPKSPLTRFLLVSCSDTSDMTSDVH